MFTNPIDNSFSNLSTGINQANNNLQSDLDILNQQAQNGTLNPASMMQVQKDMGNFAALMTLNMGLIKQESELTKSIAQSVS